MQLFRCENNPIPCRLNSRHSMIDTASQALEEFRTLRDVLRWAVSCFHAAQLYYGHGTDNAWDEAVALLLHALHLPPNTTPQILDAHLLHSERKTCIELIRQRVVQRVPAAYLTQTAWFAGLAFYVDPRVLIPRSALAEAIEHRFSPWIKDETDLAILDLCTGSACIAIAAAIAFPDAKVDAVDISPDALAVARINVDRHGVASQVSLIQSDLFTELENKRYDIIISNPPYVDAADMASLPDEYRHEPILGLAAGTDGLTIVDSILKTARQHLTPNGILIVEVGNSETALIEKYPELPFTWLTFDRSGDNGIFLLAASQL